MFECLLEEFDYKALIEKLINEIAQQDLLKDPSLTPNSQQKNSRFDELGLLKTSFSPELVVAVSNKGMKAWYALTFCLRFHITWMNFFFSAIQDMHLLENENHRSHFLSICQIDETEYLSYLEDIIKELHVASIPLLGFSAIGVHGSLQRFGFCRAFDRDSISRCSERTDGVFCSLHANENWWSKNNADQCSSQAKMFQFYSDVDNFYSYSEEELEHLVGKFWSKLRSYQKIDKDDIEKALELFGFLDQKELIKSGAAGLRKKFLHKSLQCHPDMGGEKEHFISLRNSYEVLKFLFS